MNKSITPGHAITGAAWVAAIVLLVVLVACDGNLGMNGLTPRQYKEPLNITTQDLDARYAFARSADDVVTLCDQHGIRKPPPGSYTTGCAIRPGSKFNSTNRWLIFAVRPVDWNDTASLANMGHETLHGLGATHE